MFADTSPQGRKKRSIAKENFENKLMSDFSKKDIEEKAFTGSKEVLSNTFGNRETNKFGYVDIDLVPRETAVVKLRDTKKSRFKNFLQKFKFKKKKAINVAKPKRSCPQNRRRERFNPIKKLKSLFKNKEPKDKEYAATDRLLDPDNEMVNSQMGNYKPIKFSKPLSVADMRQQIPNISDVYFEPKPKELKKTTSLSSKNFKLDDKDHDFLYNYLPETSAQSIKPPITSASTPCKFSPRKIFNLIYTTELLLTKSTIIELVMPCSITVFF